MEEFEFSYGFAGVILSSFYLTYALSQLPVGFVTDRITKKLLITPGILLMSAGMALTSFAKSFWGLLNFQGLNGIDGSIYHPADSILCTDQ